MHIGYRQRCVFIMLLTIIALIFIASCSGGGSNDDNTPLSPREWGEPKLIETSNAGDVDLPRIAMDGDGNAIAVWKQRDDVRTNIWASYFNGTSWGAAELLETNNAGDADSPQIAMEDDGNAVAVWAQYDGIQFSIYANYFDDLEWGTPELIENNDSGSAYNPQIAMDSAGNAMVVWEQRNGALTNIWVNYFDGEEWDTAERIEDGDGGAPQIAIDDDGAAMVVWTQYDISPYNIWAKNFNGTSWSAAELIDSNNIGSAYYPQIAMDSAGNAIAVWQQHDGFRYNIWANYYDADTGEEDDEDDEDEEVGEWDIAKLIETKNTGNANAPQVVMDSDGNAIAVWVQYDGAYSSIYANHFDGTSWGTAELIETDDVGNANAPQVVMDSDGNAIAVWAQYDGAHFSIYANHFDGISWGTAELIETDDVGNADSPQIVMDAAGNAMAVWVQYDGAQFSVYANRFE
jgi:hypothetical protein